MYILAANIVMTIHASLVIGVLVGILASVRFKRFRPIESLILLSAVVIWSLYDGCPLTYLENYLRVTGGDPTILLQSGFIPYYANEWFGTAITRSELTIVTYATAFLFFAISIEWIHPYLNPTILKLRHVLKR